MHCDNQIEAALYPAPLPPLLFAPLNLCPPQSLHVGRLVSVTVSASVYPFISGHEWLCVRECVCVSVSQFARVYVTGGYIDAAPPFACFLRAFCHCHRLCLSR